MIHLRDAITHLVGPKGVIANPADMTPYLEDERGMYHGAATLVVLPASTAEVAGVVRLCAEAGVPIVPQGGNTGLVGGGVPFEHGGEIVISTRRLNRIRAIDPVNYTMTVEAGCILADVQAAAAAAGGYFPLNLAAAGSCHIGGNLSTNAGGLNVLRYGNARDLVLGLEVVLPDGQVWNGLRVLSKDNTGYALKHLFLGAEGTLGIITAAVLKLFPKPCEVVTAFCAVERVELVPQMLSQMRAISGDTVTAFELISRLGLEFVLRHIAGARDPMATAYPWYALIELSSSNPAAGLRAAMENMLGKALEESGFADAVIAESLDQTAALWRLRETIPEAQKYEGGSIKHDIAVPVSRVPEFLERATAAAEQAMPGIRVCAFGHVGDGNIHFNLSQPIGMDKALFLAAWERMNRVVHDIVVDMDGSVSAEHGVGRLKRDVLVQYKSPLEIGLMRAIKQVFDPKGIMNPGKVIAKQE
ncbi:MAG: FAD-binding oxidoreductase [Alphaproteobacteria bacterium]|nr:FAD-binding oxidoreductase [Alphaproteobacteria bacterium]